MPLVEEYDEPLVPCEVCIVGSVLIFVPCKNFRDLVEIFCTYLMILLNYDKTAGCSRQVDNRL